MRANDGQTAVDSRNNLLSFRCDRAVGFLRRSDRDLRSIDGCARGVRAVAAVAGRVRPRCGRAVAGADGPAARDAPALPLGARAAAVAAVSGPAGVSRVDRTAARLALADDSRVDRG